MHLTVKQFTIMKVIVAGEGKDAAGNIIPADMDQILERVDYKTTKESMQFSLRALIRNGLIEKGAIRHVRRGRQRVVFFPTDLGKKMTQLGSLPSSFMEPVPDEVSELLEPASLPEASPLEAK